MKRKKAREFWIECDNRPINMHLHWIYTNKRDAERHRSTGCQIIKVREVKEIKKGRGR